MSSLIQVGGASVTSRDIAELVEKRHDNVKRTIETLAERGVIESPQIEEIQTATNTGAVYVFSGEQGKRDSLCRRSPSVSRCRETSRRRGLAWHTACMA